MGEKAPQSLGRKSRRLFVKEVLRRSVESAQLAVVGNPNGSMAVLVANTRWRTAAFCNWKSTDCFPVMNSESGLTQSDPLPRSSLPWLGLSIRLNRATLNVPTSSSSIYSEMRGADYARENSCFGR